MRWKTDEASESSGEGEFSDRGGDLGDGSGVGAGWELAWRVGESITFFRSLIVEDGYDIVFVVFACICQVVLILTVSSRGEDDVRLRGFAFRAGH